MPEKRTILVIEDDHAISNFICRALTANDYKAIPAASGKEGLSLFFSHSPALVLLDLGLPDMDGLEVLEQPDTALVTLHEGKYHQIKRMLAARGKPVVYLKRLTMGPLMLDPALERGEWRPLSAEEVAALRQA